MQSTSACPTFNPVSKRSIEYDLIFVQKPTIQRPMTGIASAHNVMFKHFWTEAALVHELQSGIRLFQVGAWVHLTVCAK
jgi:hypothetical protein